MNRALLRLLALLSVFGVVLACAGVAHAENAVIQPSSELPWSDPAHQTPIEVYASQVASASAKRTVRVYCHGASEWAAIAKSPNVLGYVGVRYIVSTGRIVQGEDIIHLNGERVCGPLKAFAEAAQKPTKCTTLVDQERTVIDTVQVKKKVWYWQKITVKGGKTKRVHKSKYIRVMKQLPRTVTEQVPGPRVACYGSGQAMPSDYAAYSLAVHVLAHEFIHILDFTVGNTIPSLESQEQRAECFGMQHVPAFARSFGADEDDALAMGKYYRDLLYPKKQGTVYWSAECASTP